MEDVIELVNDTMKKFNINELEAINFLIHRERSFYKSSNLLTKLKEYRDIKFKIRKIKKSIDNF